MTPAERLLDLAVGAVRAHLPPGVSALDLDGFLRRQRPALLALIQRHFAPLLGGPPPAEELPELWTVAQRTAANLAAMTVAAALERERREATPAERRTLAGYSGWGGLTIEGVAHRLPAGFPAPEPRGLIHEYYTPTRVAREVARVLTPMLPPGPIDALEPSVGIGRLLRAFETVQLPIRWQAVEYSELSSRMLAALRPDVQLFTGPFERWVREHGPDWQGRLQLLVSNPPYGARGAAVAEDPDRDYREKRAYLYFLRRGLDLLAPNGLGVFLIPAGFLTGRTTEMHEARRKVLLRHHLSAAFRLPSMRANGREALFPGALLVTDLLFFRARGGALAEVDEADQGILAGRYFDAAPGHILGTELGADMGEDDQTKRPRGGYQVVGEFTGLPRFFERPLCADCVVVRPKPPPAAGGRRVGVTRYTSEDVEGLAPELAAAVTLGLRVDRYLALVAGQPAEAGPLWGELHEALRAWSAAQGNPHALVALVQLARSGNTGAERFLSAFTRSGALIPGLQQAPPEPPRAFSGKPGDVVALAEHLYRGPGRLTLPELEEALAAQGRRPQNALEVLGAAGWFTDTPERGVVELVPPEGYLSGDLWSKLDRARARHDQTAVAKLLDTIKPAVFEDIEGVSARQGWVPLELVEQWLNDTFAEGRYAPAELERSGGLLKLRDIAYDALEDFQGMNPEVLWILGWINHDRTLYKPDKPRGADNIDEVRLEKAAAWDQSFRAWCAADPRRRGQLEEAYNRQFRGYVAPSYSAEPLPIARWRRDGPRLHPHQCAAARRLLANRGGLLAFDVGVGKTYTGLATLARARQEGWARRPVVLVPNSIVWKWEADIRRVLPDYRVAVVGSKRKTISRGPRKGYQTSETDTPQERAEKWTRFQAGEYDVVLLTYTALGRTRMNEGAVRAYAARNEAIQREVALRRRNMGKRKKLSEREQAILKEGVAAWVAEQMELAEGWEYDPGIAWDDIGVDLLVVDEAQNFKNLYLPEPREGGVPRFMGNPGDGSKRAWQLDFRCAAVRQRQGGGGVVLLSATPAKNSPLELYSLIQYVDPEAWTRLGIRDPEQFIDRYLTLAVKDVLNTSMEMEQRSAVVGFQNLHELRDVLFRFAEFKTAEDVGLKLPEPRVEMVEVDLDAAQEAKYTAYVKEIEEALNSPDTGERSKILGLLARMALVAIHADLDEGYTWKTAAQVSDPASPKFLALAQRVKLNQTCGHIVFVDNVAAHQWVRQTLVNAGVPEARIALLNAETAPGAADRQRIAREFNGDPEGGEAPRFDVVVANAIAYEGIDLQTRTCAIHHLDLPWEPATLQQRNGRGVRQGNTLAAIAIYYYFARKSQDGLRFNLIQGKRGWMTQLLTSQDRATNNPGAQMDLGPEEVLLLISRNPEQTRQRLDEVRAAREAEAQKKLRGEAVRLLRSVNSRLRMAERAEDPLEGARLRAEAEERLQGLSRVPADAWPWAEQALVVRERPVLVTDEGAPLTEGLRLGYPNRMNPDRLDLGLVGRVHEGKVGFHSHASRSWKPLEPSDPVFAGLLPQHYHADWPDEREQVVRQVELFARNQLLYVPTALEDLGWHHAPDAWVQALWPRVQEVLLSTLARVAPYHQDSVHVPVLGAYGLEVLHGAALASRAAAVLPPTDAGWRAFLGAAPRSGLSWTQLDTAGRFWWGRGIPRNLLSVPEDAGRAAA